AKEAHALRGPIGPDGLLEQPLEAVPDHAPHRGVADLAGAEALHRVAQRVADRGVSVDQRTVEIEDEEGPAAHAVFRLPLPASRFSRSRPAAWITVSTIASQSPKESVGTVPWKGPSEIRATGSITSGRETPVRITSIRGIGRDL